MSFASQKNNVALYILRKDVLDAHRDHFAASNIGKGCIRYKNPAKIGYDVVAQMFIATRESKGEVC